MHIKHKLLVWSVVWWAHESSLTSGIKKHPKLYSIHCIYYPQMLRMSIGSLSLFSSRVVDRFWQ
jgi:hypothetical protein